MVGSLSNGSPLWQVSKTPILREPRAAAASLPAAGLADSAQPKKQDPIKAFQAAIASGAGLGPPTGYGNSDNQTSQIHSEVIINGKVVARAYNSGGLELADGYGFLSEELGFNADAGAGPDLAASRIARIEAALESYGASTAARDGGTSGSSLKAFMETVLAKTAKTQDEWIGEKSRFGLLQPGSLFSATV